MLNPSCLEVMGANRQRADTAKEIGGQLFARFAGETIVVEVATITSGRSKRTRYGFWPDRNAERDDIEQLFKDGLHYIGDWHTHPEPYPSPSSLDQRKMLDIFKQSRHQLDAMLMVIVGQEEPPDGLFVGAVTASGVALLHALAQQ